MLIYLALLDTEEEQLQFRDLHDRYARLLFTVARRILGNEQDAEDAVQEAFLVTAKNFSKISRLERHKMQSYLVTIVENKAIDIYRKKAAHPTQELLESIQGVPVDYEGADAVAGCLLRLPARYRAALLLQYHHGFSGRETARLMGLSEPALRKLTQRAKERLEGLCKEEGLL